MIYSSPLNINLLVLTLGVAVPPTGTTANDISPARPVTLPTLASVNEPPEVSTAAPPGPRLTRKSLGPNPAANT